MSAARRFRVRSWTHTYKQFHVTDENGKSFTAEDGSPLMELRPVAPTHFVVELLSLTMDGVEVRHGEVTLTLDTSEALTGENYQEIRRRLIDRKLLVDGGLLDSAPATLDGALASAKSERWHAITSIRDGMEAKGFPYLNHWFDSDERSVARINTAAQAATAAALLGQDFTMEWTTADNQVVPMTRDEVIGMPVAFAAYANSLHEKARSLRQRITDATTIHEVNQCIWEGVEQAPVGG